MFIDIVQNLFLLVLFTKYVSARVYNPAKATKSSPYNYYKLSAIIRKVKISKLVDQQ